MSDNPWGIYYHDKSGHFHFRTPDGQDIDLYTCDEEAAIAYVISGHQELSLREAREYICERYSVHGEDLSPEAQEPKIKIRAGQSSSFIPIASAPPIIGGVKIYNFHEDYSVGDRVEILSSPETRIHYEVVGQKAEVVKVEKDGISVRTDKGTRWFWRSPESVAKVGNKDPDEALTRPMYYGGKDAPYEVFKVMEAWDPEAFLQFCRMNTIKYLARAGKKEGPAQLDYDKAVVYAKEAANVHRRITESGDEA